MADLCMPMLKRASKKYISLSEDEKDGLEFAIFVGVTRPDLVGALDYKIASIKDEEIDLFYFSVTGFKVLLIVFRENVMLADFAMDPDWNENYISAPM